MDIFRAASNDCCGLPLLGERMRRLAVLGLAFALAQGLGLGDERAEAAQPLLEFINASAGGLYFLIIRRGPVAPAHPTAQLIGCEEGHANCTLARARGVIGERLTGCDGVGFRSDEDLKEQILDAFVHEGAPAKIELDFKPERAGGEPNRVVFTRR
jgi:hypothetical protein